jgi:hypothetical protein
MDHVEELHGMYSSQNITRLIMFRRMGLGGHVTQMDGREMHLGCWWESKKEGDNLEDLYVFGRMMLKWILRK